MTTPCWRAAAAAGCNWGRNWWLGVGGLVGSLSLLTKAFYALWGSLGRWLFEFLWNWQYDIDHWGFTARCSSSSRRSACPSPSPSPCWSRRNTRTRSGSRRLSETGSSPVNIHRSRQRAGHLLLFFSVSNHCSFIWPVIIRTRLAAWVLCLSLCLPSISPCISSPTISRHLFHFILSSAFNAVASKKLLELI